MKTSFSKRTGSTDLRNKLLREAADFYGKLELTLQGQTDEASRKALGDAYDELAALTAKIGSKTEALDILHRALVVRQGLADANPAVAGFQYGLAASLRQYRRPPGPDRASGRGPAMVRAGQRRSARSWPMPTPPSPTSSSAWPKARSTSATS